MSDIEATELKVYIDNDGDLYRRQTTSILKNLMSKRARGEYKHDLAVKAFGYLVEAGAKKYAKEHGSPDQPWHKMFDAATRKTVANEMTDEFEAEAKLGNYDRLLPKKYQKPAKPSNGSAHARKKVTWKSPEGIKIVWSPVNQTWFALWPGKGRIEDQQVLKRAGTDDMHAWLRETYGESYGRVGVGGVHHSRRKTDLHEQLHKPGALRAATDRQLRGFYHEEKRDVQKAREEAARRGFTLHARKKSATQLDREIEESLGNQRDRKVTERDWGSPAWKRRMRTLGWKV